MSLEEQLAKNTAAIEALTVALTSGAISTGTAAAGTDTAEKKTPAKGAAGKGASGKGAAAKKGEVVDPETLKAKLVEYKNATDMKTAKALTAKLGYDAIADVPEEESKKVYDAIQAAIVALDDANTPDDEEQDDL